MILPARSVKISSTTSTLAFLMEMFKSSSKGLGKTPTENCSPAISGCTDSSFLDVLPKSAEFDVDDSPLVDLLNTLSGINCLESPGPSYLTSSTSSAHCSK